ncbi:hypothetical protein B0O99DRAFT_694328 [Bisporella sp. PMI_857]|nr:hypothetical protein B0O99DRAFT_694328 [Bisporella sp. PMI_857]
MTKTTTRTKSDKNQWGPPSQGRDNQLPSEPIHVSDDAQAKPNDRNRRQFDFYSRDRGELPERPSTSGGPSAKSSMRKNAGKRETKDDLYFNAHGKGTNFYNFPLPGALPTPAVTPKSAPAPLEFFPLRRSVTPESIDARPVAKMDMQDQQDAEIGMALGSPAHPPSTWRPQPDPRYRTISPEQDMSQDGWATPPVAAKPKGSRWKMLGGLFGGGKKNCEPQAFYQLQPEPTHQVTVEVGQVTFEELEQRSKPRGRTRTISERKTEKKKPEMNRSNTTPLSFNSQSNRLPRTPEITLDGGPVKDNMVSSQKYGSKGGLLDVDIPTTQLERYSVMFGSVLQNSSSGTSSSALLARRQATLDKLKTVNEELALKERELEARAKALRPRRATSPQPTKSPAFSLFPSTPSRLTVQDALPSPLQRSNTSPAALSPSRPSFSRMSEDGEMHANLREPPPHIPIDIRPKNTPTGKRKPDLKSTKSVPQIPKESRSKSPHASHKSKHSNASENSEDAHDQVRMPLKPKFEDKEPAWEMIVPIHGHTVTTITAGSISSRSNGSVSGRSEGHSTTTSTSSISTSSPSSHNPAVTQKHVQIQDPPATRRNRAATTSAASRPLPRPAEVSNAAFGSPVAEIKVAPIKPTRKSIEDDEEREERLKSAADISIARQISVSRQQRQLLIPIKKSNTVSSRPTASANISIKKPNPNFPSPTSQLNLQRSVSPLSSVAAGAESPVTGTPLVRQRLVPAPVKPSTPTLVPAGKDAEQYTKAWGGATAANSLALKKGREDGDVVVGLAVRSPVGEGGNRKSERVIVERVH